MGTCKQNMWILLLCTGIVPCLAVVDGSTGANTVDSQITKIFPNSGSRNGGSRITITGIGFEGDLMVPDGNKVWLVSRKNEFECPLHDNGITSTLITCDTLPMPVDDYVIKVTVRGQTIAKEKMCVSNSALCMYQVSDDRTPVIRSMSAVSGPVDHNGRLIRACGRIMSNRYESNDISLNVTNGIPQKLLRVFMGQVICELTHPDGTLFELALDSPTSMDGCLSCQIKTKMIGALTLSFILEEIGRSLPHVESLHLMPNAKIGHYEQFPEITSVSVVTGSTLGFTDIGIHGSGLGDTTHGLPDIKVGGEACAAVRVISDSHVVCMSPAQPVTASNYMGNRGLTLRLWSSSLTGTSLDVISSMSESDATFSQRYQENANISVPAGFLGSLSGYFIAPVDGLMKFTTYESGGATCKTNLSMTTDPAVATDLNVDCASTSNPVNLKAGQPYYFVLLFSTEGSTKTEPHNISVSLYTSNTFFNRGSHKGATNEIQHAYTNGDTLNETQTLTFTTADWPTVVAGVDEVQSITVTGDGQFRLIIYNQPTALLSSSMTATSLQMTLNALPCFRTNVVSVTLIDTTYTITFSGKLGNWPLFVAMETYGVTLTITEVTAGVSSNEKFMIVQQGYVSSPISFDATDEQMSAAMHSLTSILCPVLPAGIVNSYEVDVPNDVIKFRHDGNVDEPGISEPFCGKKALRNPWRLLNADTSESSWITMSSGAYRHMCLAYRGLFHTDMPMRYLRYYMLNGKMTSKFYWYALKVNFTMDSTRWHYLCVDLLATLQAYHSDVDSVFRLKSIQIQNHPLNYVNGDMAIDNFVDEFGFYQQLPANWTDLPNQRVVPSVRSRTLNVTKSSTGTALVYTVTIDPWDCVAIQPMALNDASLTGLAVAVTQTASPPVGGTFTLTAGDGSTYTVAADADKVTVGNTLSGGTLGRVRVISYGGCHGARYRLEFITKSGDLPLLTCDGSSLTGPNPSCGVNLEQDGGNYYKEIYGYMWRQHETEPQVVVTINNHPANCTDSCVFHWDSAATPTVTGISPSSVSVGEAITVTGTNFDGEVSSNNVLLLGDKEDVCTPTVATATSFTCTLGQLSSGDHAAAVSIRGKGAAQMSATTITVTLSVTDIRPLQSGLGGGILITIQGYGLKKDSSKITVEIGSQLCPTQYSNLTTIICRVPAVSVAGSVSITLKEGSTELAAGSYLSSASFEYQDSVTPKITAVSPDPLTGSPNGGESITLTGTNFGSLMVFRIMLADVTNTSVLFWSAVKTWSDTVITAELPSLPHGDYFLWIIVPNAGNAILESTNELPVVSVSFMVNSITPRKSSAKGGAVFTITGQGLDDSDVTVGDTVCSTLTSSSTEITCELQEVKTVHKIYNLPAHLDYEWSNTSVLAYINDFVIFKWKANDAMYRIAQTVSHASDELLQDGFNSGDAASSGNFTFECITEGEFFYTSGSILEGNPTIIPRGSIKCVHLPNREVSFQVTKGDISARFLLSSSRRKRETSCPNTYTDGCINDISPNTENAVIVYTNCLTGVMAGLSPTEGTSETTITITGSGFGVDPSCISVRLHKTPITVQTIIDTQITATIDTANPPPTNTPILVSLNILSKGLVAYSLADAQRHFIYKPHISSIQPSAGSVAGNTRLTINGAGFVGQVSVDVDGTTCAVDGSSTSTQIICLTGPRTQQAPSLIVNVFIYGIAAERCGSACQFSYLDSATPKVTGVTPTTVPDPSGASSTTLTITGVNFGTTAANVVVKIGAETCTVGAGVTETSIECDVANLPHGTAHNKILINVSPRGRNRESDDVAVSGRKEVTTVVPSGGSTEGGTEITINGNGFYSDATVTVGGAACHIISVSAAAVVCRTPAHSAGTANLVVSSLGQLYDAVGYTFDASLTPSISSISPASGSTAGVSVTVTGTLFSSVMTDNIVTIGGTHCLVTAADVTTITCTLPNKPAGQYPVSVHVAGKGNATNTNSATFSYTMALTAISPNEGSYGGGQAVTVTGSGLGNSVSMTICGSLCVSQSTSDTQFICRTPHQTVSGTDTVCDIVATSGTVTSELSASYTYKSSLTPTVTSVSPERGGTGGGTSLTIEGTNFGTVPVVVSVSIDGSSCVVASISATTLVCTTSAHKGNIDAAIDIMTTQNGKAVNIDNSVSFYYIDVWSSMYTWGGGPLPSAGDLVVVNEGQTLMIDMNTPVLKMLLIRGKVIADRTKSGLTLNAESILITTGGILEIGTESEPFENEFTIMLHGHARSLELPVYGSKTLAVRNGTLDLHGAFVPYTWTLLHQPALVGETTITLIHSVTWQVGQYIVIASTGDHKSQHQNEKRKIVAIDNSSGRSVLTLDSPLVYRHEGHTENFTSNTKTTTLEVRAEVGLLTRTVKVTGNINQDFVETIKACDKPHDPGQFAQQECFQGRFGEELGSDQFGAAIMAHAPEMDSGLARVHLSYIEITFAGQAFRLGRYPVHFHMNGNSNGSYVRGCGIHWTFNRAINIHNSHHVLIEHNVIYNVMGGAVFLEDGLETNNVMQYNLLIFVRASSSLLNDDKTPAAFWVTHPNNVLRHNNIAGGTHFGVWYRMLEHPEGPSYNPNICPRKAPFGEFTNNTVHSVGWYGLWIFETYFPMLAVGNECSRNTHAPAVLRDLRVWNSFRGAEWVDCGAIQFHNFVVANNFMAGLEMYFIHKTVEKFSEKGALIKDAVVIAYLDGIPAAHRAPVTRMGIVLPFASSLLISGAEFYNFDCTLNGGEKSAAFGMVKIICVCSFLCSGYMYKLEKIYWHPSSTCKANIDHANMFTLYDLDGTLTGVKDSKVVSSNPILNPVCTVDQSSTGWSTNLPGAICPPNVSTVKLSLNAPNPISLLYKDMVLTVCDASGTPTGASMSVPWREKDDSYPKGWIAVLQANQTYCVEWKGMEYLTNISYNAHIYGLKDGVYVTLMHKNLNNVAWDRVQVRSDVPYQSTIKMNRPVQYKDPNGAFSSQPAGKMAIASYIASGENVASYSEVSIKFQLIKCMYEGCVDPNTIELSDDLTRPINIGPWSKPDTWVQRNGVWYGMNKGEGSSNTIPPDGATVFIERGKRVLVDVSTVVVNKVTIEGILEFEHLMVNGAYMNHTFKAYHIIVRGGFLLAGYMDMVYQGDLNIVLLGTITSPVASLDGSTTTIGAKSMAVYGGVELHGVQRYAYTHLASTVQAGASTISVYDPVNWAVGDTIGIASTGYSPHETERRTIVSIAITGSTTTIGLDSPLTYKHISESETLLAGVSYSIKAEVVRISRNIRIMGATDGSLDSQGYGCMVRVGRELDIRDPTNIRSNMGYFNASNVQFQRCGQFGFVDAFDPRFALTMLDMGDVNSTKVVNCSFDISFATAVGFIGSNQIEMNHTVIYDSVSPSIRDEGSNNKYYYNRVLLSRFTGTFNGRNEQTNVDYSGCFALNKASNITLVGNIVSGCERVGYRIDGQSMTTPTSRLWRDNVVHSSMIGIYMLFDEEDCESEKGAGNMVQVTGFTAYRIFSFGFYAQVRCSMLLKSNNFYDNAISIVGIIIEPNAKEHNYMDKSFTVDGGLIVGQSPWFSCTEVKTRTEDVNNVAAASDAAPLDGSSISHMSVRYGKCGILWPFFLSEDNMAPEKPFIFAKMTSALYGKIEVKGVYFAHFAVGCDKNRNRFICSNTQNPDVEQPITTSRLTKHSSVEEDSLTIFPPPDVRYASIDECVDMDCDSKKKLLIEDVDGTLLGSRGYVLPNSAYEWGGDPKRGLGDYRIPTVMQTNIDGSKIPFSNVYTKKGIVGAADCPWSVAWNAYKCISSTGKTYKRFVIESLDYDFLHRRLSPVAVRVPSNGEKWLDFVSGPRAVGICHGYACSDRISTFYMIADQGSTTEVFFTSTTPQHLRVHLQHETFFILKVYMGLQYRYDVFYKKQFIVQKNYNPATKQYLQGQQYEVTLSDPYGSNYFDIESKMLSVYIGPGITEIKLTSQIIMSTSLTAMSVADFYEDSKLIGNLADYLGIPANKISIMKVVSESSSRKKRSTGIQVVFAIGNGPPTTVDADRSSEAGFISTNELIAMSNKLIYESQEGDMSQILGTAVGAVSIGRPAPAVNDEEAWEAYIELMQKMADEGGDYLKPIHKPIRMNKMGLVDGNCLYEGKPFEETPSFMVVDEQGVVVPLLATSDGSEWIMSAELDKSDQFAHRDAKLVGKTSVIVRNGYAVFSGLGISHTGYNYKIRFSITNPPGLGIEYTHTMLVPVVPKRKLKLDVALSKSRLRPDEQFTVEIRIKDSESESIVGDLDWKGDTWAVRVYPSGMIDQNVEVIGNGNMTLINYGYHKFQGMALRGDSGKYALSVIVRTPNADYAMVHTQFVQLEGEGNPISIDTFSKSVKLRFHGEFAAVSVHMEMFLLAVYNLLKKVTNKVEFYNMNAYNGSIYVKFSCHGEEGDVEAALSDIGNEFSRDGSLRFGDYNMAYSPYMEVDGVIYRNLDGSERGLSKAAIIAMSVVIPLGVVTIIIIVVVIFCCKKKKEHSNSSSNVDLKEDVDKSIGIGHVNQVYAVEGKGAIVYDSKIGEYKTLSSSVPSSGYSSRTGSAGTSVGVPPKVTKANNRNILRVTVGADNISRPSSVASEGRPKSSASIASNQEIQASFTPREEQEKSPNSVPMIQ